MPLSEPNRHNGGISSAPLKRGLFQEGKIEGGKRRKKAWPNVGNRRWKKLAKGGNRVQDNHSRIAPGPHQGDRTAQMQSVDEGKSEDHEVERNNSIESTDPGGMTGAEGNNRPRYERRRFSE